MYDPSADGSNSLQTKNFRPYHNDIISIYYSANTSQVVPAQSRTRDKTYPDFLTSKSYPVFTEVYHLLPADHQVVPE